MRTKPRPARSVPPQATSGDAPQKPCAYDPAILLTHVVVENFRSLRRAAIAFEPRVTTFIGENNCGKSAILDVIDVILGHRPGVQGSKDLRDRVASLAMSEDGEGTAQGSGETRFTLVFGVLRSPPFPEDVRGRLASALETAEGVGPVGADAGRRTLAIRITLGMGAAVPDASMPRCEVLAGPDLPIVVPDPWSVLGALREICPVVRLRPFRSWNPP